MTEHHPEETMPVAFSETDCPDLPDELVDELLAGARTPEEITGPDGLLQRLTKRLVERAMVAELTDHLGYEHGQAPPGGVGNARNGTTPKTVHIGHGSVRIEQPRDRAGSFEPQITAVRARQVPPPGRQGPAPDLHPVDVDAAAEALASFEAGWGERYPMIGKTWRDTWEHVIPFLAFPEDVRRVVYTTNTIEALHRQIRKTIKTRGHFPNEDAARKLIYLAIVNAQKSRRSTYNWSAALLSFKIHFGDRLP